jgi:phosphatidylglycerophosphatase A
VTRPAMTRLVATFGYLGLLPGPAGAWASLAALPLGYLLHLAGGPLLLALAILAASALGLRAIRAETPAGLAPAQVVIDDVVGQWIALMPLSLGLWLAGAPPHVFPWPGWVGGFLLFRLFAAWRPWPVARAARRPGPAGVMLAAAAAGALAALAVTLLAAVAHGWLA